MIPVSVNQQYGRSRWGNIFLTKESLIYKSTVQTLAKQAVREQGWDYMERGFVKVIALYVMPQECRQDLINDKLTADSLEGIVYANDKQIIDLRMVKIFGTNFQETILIIKPLSKSEYEKFTGNLLQVAAENSGGESDEISGESQCPP